MTCRGLAASTSNSMGTIVVVVVVGMTVLLFCGRTIRRPTPWSFGWWLLVIGAVIVTATEFMSLVVEALVAEQPSWLPFALVVVVAVAELRRVMV